MIIVNSAQKICISTIPFYIFRFATTKHKSVDREYMLCFLLVICFQNNDFGCVIGRGCGREKACSRFEIDDIIQNLSFRSLEVSSNAYTGLLND